MVVSCWWMGYLLLQLLAGHHMGGLDLEITYCSKLPHTLYYTHHLDGIVGYLSDVQYRGSTCTSRTCINYFKVLR